MSNESLSAEQVMQRVKDEMAKDRAAREQRTREELAARFRANEGGAPPVIGRDGVPGSIVTSQQQ